MQGNRNAIQLIGLIMSQQVLDVNRTFDLIEILNSSFPSCRDIITILEDVFKHEKSGKILIAVSALQYFVKNCSENFHGAANRESFQRRLLSLLNRVRGKTNLIKQLNSNTDNWCRIQAKVLYIVQLWYDALMMQQSKYQHIINTYKTLRKQNITFPPRSKNQKNLIFIQTESPIFDNLEQIAVQDQKKFNKKLNAMGMRHLASKMNDNVKEIQIIERKKQKPSFKLDRQVNIDQVSEKIAIIQSTQFSTPSTIKVIEQIKKAIEYGKVKPNEQAYWKQIKTAAEQLVSDWQQRNAELIKNEQQLYLQRKLGMIGVNTTNNRKEKVNENLLLQIQSNVQNNNNSLAMKEKSCLKRQESNQKQQIFDLLDDLSNLKQKEQSLNCPKTQNNQINLLDL